MCVCELRVALAMNLPPPPYSLEKWDLHNASSFAVYCNAHNAIRCAYLKMGAQLDNLAF